MKDNQVIVGGIIKYRDGYGFKLVFGDTKKAVYYKDMFKFILNSDDLRVNNRMGYYDKKDKEI